jgi:hypothetical protein
MEGSKSVGEARPSRGYRGFAFQSRRARAGREAAAIPTTPKRGYGIKPGANKPLPGAWATPQIRSA